MDKDQVPRLLYVLKQPFFKKIWIWIVKRPPGFKIGFLIAVVVLLFALARFNIFGEPFYKYSQLIFSDHFSNVKKEGEVAKKEHVIPLMFTYEIENSPGLWQTGRPGDTYFSDDRISISLKSGVSCWLTVFGVDSKKVPFAIFQKELNPAYITEEENFEKRFKLDNITGMEVYYAIASQNEFDFDSEVKPYLDEFLAKTNFKQDVLLRYKLDLPATFTQKMINFKHFSRVSM